jgi:hypothetical protein
MTTRRLASLALGLALIAAACGGSDTASTTTTAGAGATTTTAAPATTTTAAPTTTAPETTTTVTETTVAASGGDASGLKAAIAQTSEIDSARMEGSFQMTGIEAMPGGIEIVMPFSGAFDNAAGAFSFVMDMSGFAAAAGDEIPPGFEDLFGEMEIRQIGDTAYMRFGLFGMFLGEDVTWIELPADEAGTAAGSFGAASPGNPAEFLGALEDADADVVEVGPDTVRGVDTTHYMVTFDMEKLLEQATPEERAELEAQGPLPVDRLPMDVWIGEDGLIYRYVMTIDGSTVDAAPGEGFETMVMTFEIFDYGASIDIEAPPADEVTSSDELGGLFGF